jgi:signal transduction histidine kinase
MDAFLIALDTDGAVTHWNPSAETVLGVPAEAAVGQPLSGLRIGWETARVAAAMAECRRGQRRVLLAQVCLRRPGLADTLLGMEVAQLGDDGGSLVLMGVDLTERIALEQSLAQAQKLESIGQLAAGIAHEINTPIQYVGDNLRFLRDAFGELLTLLQRPDPSLCPAGGGSPAVAEAVDLEFLIDEIPRAAEQSLEGVESVARIVRAMKEFSHPGSDDKVEVDLNHAIESTITVARNEWRYVAELHTELDPSLPPVPCLPGELNQVILNLLINAAHAIAAVVGDGAAGKGTIRVSTGRVGDWAEIRISDTGCGIPEAIRDRIYDPFFTTKEVGRGTGQGLAIARSVIVDKHGGQIGFVTEPGEGTTFTLRLPLHAQGGRL